MYPFEKIRYYNEIIYSRISNLQIFKFEFFNFFWLRTHTIKVLEVATQAVLPKKIIVLKKIYKETTVFVSSSILGSYFSSSRVQNLSKDERFG